MASSISDRELSLGGSDEQVYQRLPFIARLRCSRNHTLPLALCSQIAATECLEMEGSSCPDHRTFARQDVQEFLDHDEFNKVRGAWSVLWTGKKYSGEDTVHDDGFRSVVMYKAIHIMIRPPDESNNTGSNPPRLFITPLDAKNFLEAALTRNPSNRMGAVLGEAIAEDPKDFVGRTHKRAPELEPEPEPKVALEWKVGLAPAYYLETQVVKWRNKQWGGYERYLKEMKDFNHKQDTSRQVAAGPSWAQGSIPGPSRAYQGGPAPSPYPQQSIRQWGKRPSWEMEGSQEMGSGSKRPSFGSLHGSTSQLGRASQSFGGSREFPRGDPDAEWEESTGSEMGHISTTMAGLAVTSAENSPAGIPPPTAGAPWGMPQDMPQDMSRTAFGQSGGGFEHQGRGGVHMVNEFGHMVERPIPGPSRMGFPPSMPPMVPAGQYGPPQQWQQEVPSGQYPAQRHSGTRYSGSSGHSTRTHDPDHPSGQNLPPRFPPRQQGSYGMETRVPQPLRQMSGGSQQAGDYPPRLQHMPMTQSPELLDQGAGSAPFSSGPGPLQDLQPLPPPATHGIGRAQFLPPTTLAPGAEDYSSSLAPSAQGTPAGVPFQPGPGFESGVSESGREDAPDSDGEDASESDGEDSVSEGEAPMENPAFHQHQAPYDVELHAQGDREDQESGGEDAPGSYEEHSVAGREAAPEAPEIHTEDDSEDPESDGQDDQGSPSQYLGAPGDPRFYNSPSPNPPGQYGMHDPFVGRPGSEERGSDDPDSADEFTHRRTR